MLPTGVQEPVGLTFTYALQSQKAMDARCVVGNIGYRWRAEERPHQRRPMAKRLDLVVEAVMQRFTSASGRFAVPVHLEMIPYQLVGIELERSRADRTISILPSVESAYPVAAAADL
jgi:hypothetical protein